jgi:uroporphyrin-III C-methyltransferase
VSDQQDKNIEQVAQETAAADEAMRESSDAVEDETIPVAATVPAAAPSASAAQTPRKGSSVIAWLALLLVIALAAGGGWLLREQQGRDVLVTDRLQKLEVIAGQKQANLDGIGDRLQGQLQAGLGTLESGMGELRGEVGDIGNESSRLAQSIQVLEAQLAEQRAELARYSANDRQDWLLAEAQYLLRLANQRLIMAGDVKAAQALLSSADNILKELDDVGMHPVRAAVAADLAAVRAVPRVDVEGIYLRLAALIEQGDKLVIFQLPEPEQQPQRATADDWKERLRLGYQQALEKLSSYVIIRRRDVPMQALMDPQWEGLVRQNLRMLLEQAQVALLSGNQTLYRESLQRARHWVVEFFESDEAAARAMAREIDQLESLTVEVDMPDISRSLRALDNAIEQRVQQGGVE